MKQVIIVELATSDVVWLAWAAGVATGQENEDAAKSLSAMLQRIQFVNVPEDVETSEGEDTWEDDGGAFNHLAGAEEAEERDADPRFAPPPPAPPMNRQDDFGAGPPPGV